MLGTLLLNYFIVLLEQINKILINYFIENVNIINNLFYKCIVIY